MTSPASTIPGGFVKSWRKEMGSEVWMMPPIYHRVWYWLRMNAQHEAFLFPTRGRFGIWVLPGQRITSLQQIAEGVKWVEWGRQVVPNKKTLKNVLDWLVQRKMVTVESNAKGTLVSIVNWHSYNILVQEKVTGQSNSEGTRSGHKLEVKEVIEVKTSCALPKPKRTPRPPSGDQQTFLAWWSHAYKQVMNKPYMISGKDAKAAADLLKVHTLKPLVIMGSYFLTCSDSWLDSKRDLLMFRSMINRIPGHKDQAHDADVYRDAGIIPPHDVMFEDWRFWEHGINEEAA